MSGSRSQAPADAPPGMWTIRLERDAGAADLRIQSFLDDASWSWTYLVYDEASRIGVVIDPPADPVPHGAHAHGSANERIAAEIDRLGIDLHYALSTRLREDPVGGLHFFANRFGAIPVIAAAPADPDLEPAILRAEHPKVPHDLSDFDVRVREGDVLRAGPVRVEVFAPPGATGGAVRYRIADAWFVGDADRGDGLSPQDRVYPDRGSRSVDRPSARTRRTKKRSVAQHAETLGLDEAAEG